MRERDNQELPSFGPADPGRVSMPPEKQLGEGVIAQSVNAEKGAKKTKGFILFIVLLLAAVVAALGYWGSMQQAQIKQQQTQLLSQNQQIETLSSQLIELQQLLKNAESSVAATDESLLEWVNNRATAADQKYQELDQEIARIWTQVKDQQAEQAKVVAGNTAAVAEQKQALADLGKNLTGLQAFEQQLQTVSQKADEQKNALSSYDKQLSELEAGLNKQVASVSSKLGKLETAQKSQNESLEALGSPADAKQLDQVRADLAALSADYQILAEGQELQRVALAQQGKDLSRKIDQTANAGGNSAGTAALERRVSVNEQAVKAIDGSRLVLNKELLRIRQRLNNLQLQVESLQ